MAKIAVRLRTFSHGGLRLAVICALLGWVSLGLSGCATLRQVLLGPSKEPVTVTVENQTDYVWQVVFTPAGVGGKPAQATVAPRASTGLTLAGGEFSIEQSLLGSDGAVVQTRTLAATFHGGQTYRWPLMTLLSNPAGSGP